MVDLDDFIKLYLNHRPVERMSLEEVEEAFKTLSDGGSLSREELLHALEVNYFSFLSKPRYGALIDRHDVFWFFIMTANFCERS